MPLYEYYCPRCTTKFEELRPLARADEPATCGKGHRGAARTLSVFAAVSRGAGGESPMPSGAGGCGCGGGACGCGH